MSDFAAWQEPQRRRETSMADKAERGGRLDRRALLLGSSSVLAAGALLPTARAQTPPAAQPAPVTRGGSSGKPNILVIFGDDIGQTNISAYSFGLVGYH